MREKLKKQIIDSIKPVSIHGEWFTMSGKIDRNAVQAALDEHKNVIIPDTGAPIEFDNPVIMRSDYHLKVAKNQLIRQTEDCSTCLIINESAASGAKAPISVKRDENISIEGGIWQTKADSRARNNREYTIPGSLGNIILSSVERIRVADAVFTDSASYAVQIDDCSDYVIENLHFDNYHKDGVHVNGPADKGYIAHLSGRDMGDDMVALNAWDWDTSAISFGSITNLVVEDVQSNNNEFRLLPGQKVFESGEKVDCNIENCVIENVSGIYTFKMYAQPNIANAVDKTRHDVSGTVGTIRNVYCRDISFARVTPSGFSGLPVKSLFEICADCDGIFIESVDVKNTIDECDKMDVRLVNVGPLSAVWKNGSDDPEKWGEVFDPDAVCEVSNLNLKNIRFGGEKISDAKRLVREVHMTVNPDYPKTTPRGGTGHGTIKSVKAE